MERQRGRWLEWFLGILAAANCAAVGIYTLLSSSDAWPFPGVFVLEIILAGLLNLYPVAKDLPVESRWHAVPWASSGITLAFVILGAWTSDFFLLPAMIAFLLLGILSDRRRKGNTGLHFLFFITAAFIQALVFFLLVSF